MRLWESQEGKDRVIIPLGIHVFSPHLYAHTLCSTINPQIVGGNKQVRSGMSYVGK